MASKPDINVDVIACPDAVDYSAEESAAIADALEALEPDNILWTVVGDFIVISDQINACHAAQEG